MHTVLLWNRFVKQTLMFSVFFAVLFTTLIALHTKPSYANDYFSETDYFNLRYVLEARINPDGQWVAYTAAQQRDADDEPGTAYRELFLVSTQTKEVRPYITGKKSIGTIRWRPDGSAIAFLAKRKENEHTQVWMIPFHGGEARQISDAKSGVKDFHWHPNGKQIAYIAPTPKTERENALEEKGYDFVFYEEDWKHDNLYLLDVKAHEPNADAVQLTRDITITDFVFSKDGSKIAAAAMQKNLIDFYYMFRKVYVLDLETKSFEPLTDNPGKLGNFAFSPNGEYLAYSAARSQKDHAVSQAYVIPVEGGAAKNLTPSEFRGHIEWVAWKNNNTVVYKSSEGVESRLSTVSRTSRTNRREILLDSKETGFVFDPPSYTEGFEHIALVGNTPNHPGDIYFTHENKTERLTEVNPWLTQRIFGKQEVIRYPARDGVEIEGLLIHPAGHEEANRHPLVVIVHGGPESHYSNGWVTSYSTPGQVLSGKGYTVFYPNYRSSTGYGVEFGMVGFGDPAGVEFDDIADGINYLIQEGYADENRVGLGGGSYGGYASAWFATYYTKLVKAVCMFVGISDVISKRGTTDIPYEMLYVHHGKPLEEMWDISLKRSPIYYAHQSRTATLIYAGLADTRVDPGQSKELYRRMKMNHHPAVRFVGYPGEGHGNRKQPGRIDVLYRILDWYDWYVKDAKPLDGPMPPLDISEKYGLELPE